MSVFDYSDLSIVIPIGPKETVEALKALDEYLMNFKGAEVIREFGGTIWEARKYGVDKSERPYILCLDVDTRVSEEYIQESIGLIKNDQIDVSAIDYFYPHHQKHPAFGTSIWKTRELKRIYDWKTKPDRLYVKIGKGKYSNISSSFCECEYMWIRCAEEGLRFLELDYRAIHLKEKVLNVHS